MARLFNIATTLALNVAGLCTALIHPHAEPGIRVDVPTECQTEHSQSANDTFPFLDALGDARFAPRRPTMTLRTTRIVQPNLVGMPVSAALMPDRHTLLITTYQNIIALDTITGSLHTLTPDLNSLDNQKYVPTGISVGAHSGRIFVANYLANDVLIGHLVNDRIIFDKELTGDRLISPENVATTNDEKWIVSANFDGNTVTAFALEDQNYVLKWTMPIPLAHGVAILHDMVFVSSLSSRKIIVLSLSDGAEIGSFGHPGWNSACLEFLWPTGIQSSDDGRILITDAHTGAISILKFDGRNGRLVGSFGGTYAGPSGLQMPYSAAILDGDLFAVLSTFSPKISIMNEDGSIQTIIMADERQGLELREESEPGPIGVGWNGYVHFASPIIDVAGFPTVPSYGSLMRVKSGRTLEAAGPLSLVPDTLRLFGSLMYFIESRPTRGGVIVSSPSTSFLLYIRRGANGCFMKIDLPGAPLQTVNGLAYRAGTTKYGDIESEALARIAHLEKQRDMSGFLPLPAIAEALGVTPMQLRDTFIGAGKETLDFLEACDKRRCSDVDRQGVIDRYKSEVASRSDSSLIELLLLDMISYQCTAPSPPLSR